MKRSKVGGFRYIGIDRFYLIYVPWKHFRFGWFDGTGDPRVRLVLSRPW